MRNLLELREQRANVVAQAREILDKAEAEKRELTTEEQTNYDKAFADVQNLDKEIKNVERQMEMERADAAASIQEPGRKKTEMTASEAFARHLLENRIPENAPAVYNALQADSDTAGGYIKTPDEFLRELLKNADDMSFIRKLARKFTLVGLDGMGVPTLDANPADATWGTELQVATEDSTMAFGNRELKARDLTFLIKLSRKLLRVSALPIESLVNERIAYVYATTEEQAFMTGDGSNQPLGVFTASNNGIPTSRDVSSGNTTTSVQADGLINTKYSLKAQYMNRAEWIFHRDILKTISKLKDGEGQYLWQPGLVANSPDRLLGLPVNMSEFAPNTETTGQYVGILGDFQYYWIADFLSLELQRLVEKYADTNQVGFIGRSAVDGMPVLSEAFARVKLA